jgi:hypothetical protein
MSQKNSETEQKPQLETVEHVSSTVKGQKKLLLAVMAMSVVSLLSAVFAIVMSMSGGGHEQAAAEVDISTLPQDTIVRQLDNRITGVSSHVEDVLALAEQNQSGLTELSTQVAGIDVNDERNVIIRMQRLLIKQEQDFQAFIDGLEDGMYNFHMMVPRSGGWWDEYQAELATVSEKSKARENYATTLRDN